MKKWKHILLSVCMTGALIWGQEGEKLLTSAESSLQEKQEKGKTEKKKKQDLEITVETELDSDLKMNLEPETDLELGLETESEAGSEPEADLDMESETEMPESGEPEETEMPESELQTDESETIETEETENETAEPEEIETETAEPETTEPETVESETESEETDIEIIETEMTESATEAEKESETEEQTETLTERETETDETESAETEAEEAELKETECKETEKKLSKEEIKEIESKIEEIEEEELLEEPQEPETKPDTGTKAEPAAAEPVETQPSKHEEETQPVQEPEPEKIPESEQEVWPEAPAESKQPSESEPEPESRQGPARIEFEEPQKDGTVQVRVWTGEQGAAEVQLELKGQKNGTLPVQETYTQDGEWTVVEVPGMEDQEEMDDWYQLTVNVKGSDGNWNSQDCVYAVNRYGSVFHADARTEKKQETFYLNESFEPVMELENVEGIQKQKLVCIWNGVSRELVEGTDYEKCAMQTERGWQKYSYRIKKENFQEEGNYSITILTVDNAGNISDTRRSADTLSFVMDRTAPQVRIEGVADGRTYPDGKCRAGVMAGDSSGIRRLEVWMDGEVICQGEADFLEAELNQPGWHTIWAKAWDHAGNMTCSEKIRYCIAGEESRQIQNMVLTEKQPEAVQTVYEQERNVVSPEMLQEYRKKRPEKMAAVMMISIFLLVTAVCLLRKMEF